MRPLDPLEIAGPGRAGSQQSESPQFTGTPRPPNDNSRSHISVLFVCNFLSKGWEVSILGLLAFVQDQYRLPLYMVGILSAVFIVSQISVSLFAGKIAHTVHSRNVVFLSIAASGLAWLTLFTTTDVSALFLAYAFGGLSSGLFEPIGNSLIAKLSSVKNRGTAIGNFAAFGDMGRIAVIAIATALAGFLGARSTCGILFATAGASLVLALVFFPRPATDNGDETEIPIHLDELRKNRKFRLATAAGIADSFSSASLYIFIPFLLTAKGISLADTLYFNVIFFAGYMSGRLVLGRVADRYNAASTLIGAQLAMAVLLVLLIWVSGIIPTVGLLFLLGIFTRGTSPIIRAMVADCLDDQASFHNAFSVYSFASRSSGAVCRPAYGFLASYVGIASVFYAASAVSLFTLIPAAKYRSS